MKRFVVAAVSLMLGLSLAGCENAPPPQHFPPLRFADQPKIGLAVKEIRVIEVYQSPMRAPHVEQNFPIPPAQAVKSWVAERLVAKGGDAVLEITIEDASVVEQKLSRTPGFKGLFTNDQSERFDATLAVTFRLYREGTALSVAEGSVNVLRSRTVAENASVAEREQIFYDMTKQMMQAFNTEAETRLRQYFSPYLR